MCMWPVCQVVGAASARCVPIVAVPGSGGCGGEVLAIAHSSDRGINEARLLTTAGTVAIKD